jgi:hypothetical protein
VTEAVRQVPDAARLSPSTEGFLNPDPHEPLVDARIRPLLERYASTVDAQLTALGPGLVELQLPAAERKWFRNRSTIRIAFTLDALERDPEAEIAVVGSTLVEQVIAAIRARGARASHGRLAPDQSADARAAELRVPVTNGTAGVPRIDIAWHRVVRLLARVVVRAGSDVEEHLLESGFFDATTGVAIPAGIAERCSALTPDTSTRNSEVTQLSHDEDASAPGRPIADLISLALSDLRASLEPKVARLRDEARQRLHEELQRIDGYYDSLLKDSAARGSDVGESAAARAIQAEYARRRAEEERRHQVRAIVHPVQLTECELLVQCAQWELVNQRGVRAPMVAERWLNGDGDWMLACPACGASDLESLSLCKSGHVACSACAQTCGVCADVFCRDHGITSCHVDGRATCAEHARTCTSCREPYCTAHEETCAEGDHVACSDCVKPCALCGRTFCDDHATLSSASAPRGQRRLCRECVRLCEGGTGEPVGADEVTRCSSCEKYVCEHHRSVCTVDQHVHCSKHLRRTDSSRRLVCETHREECAFEPGALFASDEVGACTSCGRQACHSHSHPCIEDGRLYCDQDALMLSKQPGKYVCRTHSSICHVDQRVYRLGETVNCPVCAKATCTSHLRTCSSCGRKVCVSDMHVAQSRCGTCAQLRDVAEPSDALIDAVVTALGARQTPKRWRTARDATHTLVEVDLGWTRRAVMAVRHGDNVADAGRAHSAIGWRDLVVRARR